MWPNKYELRYQSYQQTLSSSHLTDKYLFGRVQEPEGHEGHPLDERERVVESKLEPGGPVLEVEVLEDADEAHDDVVHELGNRPAAVFGAAAEVCALATQED